VTGAPFLLLSIRGEDEAADDEYRAMMRFAGLDESGMHRIRLSHRPLGDIDLSQWSGIVLGGGPYNVSDEPVAKSPTQRRVEMELAGLLAEVIARDFPFLGCCYGVGTLGSAVGAVVHKPAALPGAGAGAAGRAPGRCHGLREREAGGGRVVASSARRSAWPPEGTRARAALRRHGLGPAPAADAGVPDLRRFAAQVLAIALIRFGDRGSSLP